jgi:TPP-dependent pyruvate/acetoin dehydrogenase alpha subunit
VNGLREGRPGPFFFECQTYRWKEHVGPNEDFQLGYRSAAEAQTWIENDQVARIAALVEPEERREIEAEVEAEIQTAFAFAETSPYPQPEMLLADVVEAA